jgi:hypothetical protein
MRITVENPEEGGRKPSVLVIFPRPFRAGIKGVGHWIRIRQYKKTLAAINLNKIILNLNPLNQEDCLE